MKKILILAIFNFSFVSFSQKLLKNFVYLTDIDATIKWELRYFSSNNFIGKPIDGYRNDCVILTKQTAEALKKVQSILKKQGLGLKVFDAYRPQQAVNHFVRWAKVMNDTLMKKEYYPKVPKSQLFQLGFIASKSGHTRGSTVDITLVRLKTGEEIDMGSPFDFFGKESHPFYKKISKEQQENRLLLRKIMLENGFKPYDNEWWHFTLKNEPYPDTYFNFLIE